MKKIVCSSDCHGLLDRIDVPRGDVLVLAGDVCPNFVVSRRRALEDADRQVGWLAAFDAFVGSLGFRHVLLVAGNHDWCFQLRPVEARAALRAITYVEDALVEVEGLRLWGSPWQPEFCDWAFNLPRDGPELRGKWEEIPDGLDLLVTHGPPHGLLDRPDGDGPHVGDALLLERVRAARPRHHVFGHIHGSPGTVRDGATTFHNVTLCDEGYAPVHAPTVIEL